MHSVRVLRWICVVPATVVAWYLVFFTGLLILDIANAMCPKNLLDSGRCTAEWYSVVEDYLIAIFTGLSAAAVVIASTLVAPSCRQYIPVVAYFLGVCVAVWAFVETQAWIPFTCAIVVGGAAAFVLWRCAEITTGSE